ncbi:MAG: HD domain-containing phosphohydrolase [Acidaminobacteraceae bacterium]
MKTILIVEDTEANIDILVKVLEDKYDLTVATNGKNALELMKKQKPDLVLLDVMMPELDGYEVAKYMSEDLSLKGIPIIFITALSNTLDKTKAFSLGAVDYITKPFQSGEVLARIESHLEIKGAREFLEKENEWLEVTVAERTKDLVESRDATIYCMAIMAEARDNETGQHVLRTQSFVKLIGEYLKKHKIYSEFEIPGYLESLYKAAPLHDIGKVAIRDNILLKAGSYTFEEYEEMKKHSLYGRDMLLKVIIEYKNNEILEVASRIAAGHHEKWDGSGYPYGKIGYEIPLEARIMAVADVFDALTTKRVYKEEFPYEKAIKIIVDGKGVHFDPVLVEVFIELEKEMCDIADQFKDRVTDNLFSV